MKANLKNRTIYFLDNLEVLHGVKSESIDLVYLDPPFYKNKAFTAPIGSSAEGASFQDIFSHEDMKNEWLGIIADTQPTLYQYITGIEKVGYAYNKYYLVYMAVRLIELHRVLKDTGSIYLHCDPTMSHYLKIILAGIFGESNFRNEEVWNCPIGRKHDIVLFYSKNQKYTFTPLKEKTYIPTLKIRNNKECTSYPTQKPLALLERIIKASSKEGDMVLDPFCGSATTCVASEKLGRKWVGIEINKKADDLIKERLKKEVHKEDVSKQTNIFSLTRTTKGKVVNYKDRKHFLFGKYEGKCPGCYTLFAFRHLEVDHITPQAKGGSDALENLQLLCGSCNRIKGNRDMPYLMSRLRELKIIA